MRSMSSLLHLWSAAIVLCTTACLDNRLAAAEPDVFIAQQRDFLTYRDWMAFSLSENEHSGTLGAITVYLNQLPPDGAQRFPVGTILVKTIQPADSAETTTLAMAKRGIGFNPKGALGWEFFELALSKTDVPYILWRGADPPSGEQYQALLGANNLMAAASEGDCNDCHSRATKDGTFEGLAELLK